MIKTNLEDNVVKVMLKLSGNVFLKIIIVTFMSVFMCLSFSVICTAAFKGAEKGYTATVYDSKGNVVEDTYTYYYADGDDLIKLKYADKIESKEYTFSSQSIFEVSKTGNAVFTVVTQLFIILLLVAFIYSKMWHEGTKDDNAVRFGHMKEDKLKGLKVGLLANVPYVLIFAWAFIAFALKKAVGLSSAIYVIANYYFWPLLNAVWGHVNKPTQYWHFAVMFLLLFIVPAISHISYTLGYKEISIGEKLTYKKKKGNSK